RDCMLATSWSPRPARTEMSEKAQRRSRHSSRSAQRLRCRGKMEGPRSEEGHHEQAQRGGRFASFGGRPHHNRGGVRGGGPQAQQRREVEPRQREIQEASNAVFVHTSDRVSVPALLKHIEDSVGAGSILQSYFKDKQNFGFIQFASPEVRCRRLAFFFVAV